MGHLAIITGRSF